MVTNITPLHGPGPMDDWTPTAEYRLVKDSANNYEVVLQRKYIKLEWPHEPYREKGEEIIHEKWETEPTETI